MPPEGLLTLQEVLPDANEREKIETTFIDIAGLRDLRRIVEEIRHRISAAERTRPGDDRQNPATRDSGGSMPASSNCGENSSREEKK
jgi:hypothetical protein